MSGKTKEFVFNPVDSAGDIAIHVYDNWPEGRYLHTAVISIMTLVAERNGSVIKRNNGIVSVPKFMGITKNILVANIILKSDLLY